MKIRNLFSPNYSMKKRPPNSIKSIVIHYTGMQSERESIKKLCDPKFKVSSHYLINRNGRIFMLVKEKYVSWHAGYSCWGQFKNLNKNSIGIELVNKGHKFGYTNFKKKQLSNLIKICQSLIKKYKIKRQNIVGHSDIAPLRKLDPGEKFPWKKLGNNKIGIWHNLKEGDLVKFRKIKIVNKSKVKFINKLKKIGYCFNSGRKGSSIKIIKAFQRHYRKELINGIIDKECLIIAKNISKKV